MASIKCPKCGLVDFATASSCKRCQAPLDHSDFNQGGDNYQTKLYGKIVGGSLIGIGMILGLATALTQNYSYLPFGGASLLVGAFIVVLLTQPIYSKGSHTTLMGARAGLACTALGCLYIYADGLFSLKALVLPLGMGLLVISVIAFRGRT